MKDGQRFIVKVIKTEADLPKEKGKYIFGWNKTEINISEGISKLIFDPKDEESIHEYIEDYDWYLQLIEEQESKETKYSKRLDAGRDFLMTQDPRYLTVEDCLEAFGFYRDGLNEIA